MTATDPAVPEPTDEQIENLWLYRKNIHGGELMPQLQEFARAVLALNGVKGGSQSSQAARAVQAEPVVWALRFPGDPRIGLSTMFDTESEAKDYAERCDSVTLVPLYDRPAAQSADPRHTPLKDLKPIAFASVVDIELYKTSLSIGPHLPGVRDVAMYTKDQLHSAVNAAQSADAVDAKRWRALPAFFEEYQIDAMKLFRDVDEYISQSAKGAKE